MMTQAVCSEKNQPSFARLKIRELKERLKRIGVKQKTLAFNNELVHYLNWRKCFTWLK